MKKKQNGEILILVILGLILAGYVTVTYLIKPMKAETETVNTQILQKEAELKTRYYTILSYSDKVSRSEELTEAIVPYAELFYADETEHSYLEHIRLNISDCRVDFISLSALENQTRLSAMLGDSVKAGNVYKLLFGGQETVLVNSEKFSSFFDELKSKNSRLLSDIQTTTMTVEASGRQSEILAFLHDILAEGKSILCYSMTLDIAENISLYAPSDPEARLELNLVFAEVPDIASYCVGAEAEELVPFAFPAKILDGSYRDTKSFIEYLAEKLDR